jgi:hypothetical protein
MPIAAPALPLMGIATSLPRRNPTHTPEVGLRGANPTYQLHRVIVGRVRRAHRTIVSARPLPHRNPTPTPHVGLRGANPTYQLFSF